MTAGLCFGFFLMETFQISMRANLHCFEIKMKQNLGTGHIEAFLCFKSLPSVSSLVSVYL